MSVSEVIRAQKILGTFRTSDTGKRVFSELSLILQPKHQQVISYTCNNVGLGCDDV